MKTLVFNGSTRKGGDTEALLGEFLAGLGGEVMMVDEESKIAPCSDCRFCVENNGCSIRDGMAAVLRFLDECDNVVIASPVWFASLSGIVLNIASRLQVLYMKQMRGESPRTRNGAILLVGARAGTEAAAERSAKLILRYLGVKSPIVVKSMDTDRISAGEDAAAMQAAREAARQMRGECQ